MLGQPDELKHNNSDYPLIDESEVRGGFRTMPDVASRNAIPTLKRKEGMEVFCVAEKTRYRLEDGIENTNWLELKEVSELETEIDIGDVYLVFENALV